MTATNSGPPVPLKRIKQIADDACDVALREIEHYDHSKVEDWNTSIINSILRALASESPKSTAGADQHKFAVTSTIVQHLVPSSQLSSSKPVRTADSGTSTTQVKSESPSEAPATVKEEKKSVGKRGMHCATGAHWNEKTDGMWSTKYEGDGARGLDVVIMVVWMKM